MAIDQITIKLHIRRNNYKYKYISGEDFIKEKTGTSSASKKGDIFRVNESALNTSVT